MPAAQFTEVVGLVRARSIARKFGREPGAA
jgi:hypothetical protein